MTTRRISEKGKLRERRGTGTGENYIPYTHTRDFGSLGTCSNPIDWKTGRTVELLSQGEAMLWHMLRWDDNVTDIQEQFKLSLEDTVTIAERLSIRHPRNKKTPMTSDFFVTYKDGSQKAFSLKVSEKSLSDRDIQKLCIEKLYWASIGIPYELVFKEDLNSVFFNNIRLVVEYYDASRIHDRISVIKHLIARKRIIVDMESTPLDFPALVEKHLTVLMEVNNG